MVDKIKLSSLSNGIEGEEVYLEIETIEEHIEELILDEPETIEESITEPEPELEDDIQVHTLTSALDEVFENSLVEGTDNIYMKEKKYILPIENLDDSTYEVQQEQP